mmetsp:Transcript_121488/g.388644  ORF Transcript_121488/g.388644 Transcript_121488/m.388644 type:complete len:341 (+) Transcript_121488:635-1657(+)
MLQGTVVDPEPTLIRGRHLPVGRDEAAREDGAAVERNDLGPRGVRLADGVPPVLPSHHRRRRRAVLQAAPLQPPQNRVVLWRGRQGRQPSVLADDDVPVKGPDWDAITSHGRYRHGNLLCTSKQPQLRSRTQQPFDIQLSAGRACSRGCRGCYETTSSKDGIKAKASRPHNLRWVPQNQGDPCQGGAEQRLECPTGQRANQVCDSCRADQPELLIVIGRHRLGDHDMCLLWHQAQCHVQQHQSGGHGSEASEGPRDRVDGQELPMVDPQRIQQARDGAHGPIDQWHGLDPKNRDDAQQQHSLIPRALSATKPSSAPYTASEHPPNQEDPENRGPSHGGQS